MHIKNKVNISIFRLVNILNKGLNKKIKVKYSSKSTTPYYQNNLKILPKWKPLKNLESKIIKTFKNETS